MTYASLLEAYGYERFADDAQAAGATSLIVADLPAGAHPELPAHPARRADVDGRAPPTRCRADGRLALPRQPHRHDRQRETRSRRSSRASSSGRGALTSKPLYVGFGISTPEHAAAAAALADGVVVGSRAVEVAEEGPTALLEYVASLRAALDAV